MELNWVEAFVAVAETGSFSLAADRLFLTQSVVSKQVQKLERSLGLPLFDRGHRRVSLTAAGQRLLPEATALLEQHRRMLRAVGPQGVLRLVLLPVADCYGLPRRLAEFAAQNPAVQVQVEEQTNTAAHEMLQADRCDGAFYRVAPGQVLPEKHLLLARDELVLLVRAGHPLAQEQRMPLAAFAQENFLLLGSGTGLQSASLELCRRAGFAPRVGYTGSSGRNIARMVQDGVGVAMLAEQVARDLLTRQLQLVRLQPTCESLLIFAASASGIKNPAMEALWTALQTE